MMYMLIVMPYRLQPKKTRGGGGGRDRESTCTNSEIHKQPKQNYLKKLTTQHCITRHTQLSFENTHLEVSPGGENPGTINLSEITGHNT